MTVKSSQNIMPQPGWIIAAILAKVRPNKHTYNYLPMFCQYSKTGLKVTHLGPSYIRVFTMSMYKTNIWGFKICSFVSDCSVLFFNLLSWHLIIWYRQVDEKLELTHFQDELKSRTIGTRDKGILAHNRQLRTQRTLRLSQYLWHRF